MRNHISSGLIKTLALSAVVLGASASLNPASATPSTLGFYPSTDIYGPGNFHFDADAYGRGARGDVSMTTGLTYGIGDREGLFGRNEIGFDYAWSAGGGQPLSLSTGTRLEGTKRLTLNAKTQLFNNTDSGTRVVAGFWGVGSKDFGAPNVGYIQGSKTFDFGRVHLGVAKSFAGKIGGTRVTGVANPGGGIDDDTFHITAGYDRYITEKLQLCVDYYSGKSSYAGVQPTLYYYINDKADFGLGLFRGNANGLNPRNQVYICFDYNFGGGGAAPEPETAPAAPAAN